jgi:hypothetical protein
VPPFFNGTAPPRSVLSLTPNVRLLQLCGCNLRHDSVRVTYVSRHTNVSVHFVSAVSVFRLSILFYDYWFAVRRQVTDVLKIIRAWLEDDQKWLPCSRCFGCLHFASVMLLKVAWSQQLMLDEDSIRNRNSLCERVQGKCDELFAIFLREIGDGANQA